MAWRRNSDYMLVIAVALNKQVIEKLKQSKVPESWLTLVSEVTELSESESKRVFGDALPSGLSLINS